MTRKFTSLLISALLITALVACGGGAEPPAGSDAPTAAATQPPVAAQPTAEPQVQPTAETRPTAEPQVQPAAEVLPSPAPAVLCPDLPRPALIVNNGPAFEAVDAASGTRCDLGLPSATAYPQATGEAVYFVLFDHDAGSSAVYRSGASGPAEPLESTRVTNDVHYLLRFALSADGRQLAWAQMQPAEDPNATELPASLWIGDAGGGAATAVFENVPGGQMRIVSPIRFSADGQTLFFTWEPVGLGGMWASFNGRYDNLYRVPAGGGEPLKVFDCADADLFLCLGDFRDDGTLAYIDTGKTIHVNGPDGAELAAVATASDYAGYPTFSPAGDLFYSEAMVDESEEMMPLPAPGTIYRLDAPYSGTPAVVASGDGLLLSAMRDVFLDGDHVAVNTAEGEQWGLGLMDAAGAIARIEPFPNAYLAGILR